MKTFNIYNAWSPVIVLIITLNKTISVQGTDEIANHIRKCCRSGLRHARIRDNCANYEYEVVAIPQLWRGLCYSTYGVCCSREIENQHCEAGRLAARIGSRCDEQPPSPNSSTSYADCCRFCQVGLAVKASENNCSDELFSYFAKIESYHICCFENTTAGFGGDKHVLHNPNDELDQGGINEGDDIDASDDVVDEDYDDNHDKVNRSEKNNKQHTSNEDLTVNAGDGDGDGDDGTIVLREDDDDICGKVPNLCEHICENTKEAYRCKCRLGYKMDDNNVTCTPVIGNNSAMTEGKLGKENLMVDAGVNNDSDEDYNGATLEDTVYDNIKPNGDKDVNDKRIVCPIGYKKTNRSNKCIDVNECIMNLGNCKSNQYCHNTIGSYRCLNINTKKCELGYRFNIETDKCEDYNECEDSPCAHDINDECINYEGHYECKKRLDNVGATIDDQQDKKQHDEQQVAKCGDGFQLKHGHCVDIDECVIDQYACDSSQVCTNDIGGYHCVCKIGFNLDTTTNACVGTGNCDDDDECILNTHNCTPDYECFNTKGSFRCYRRPPSTTPKTTTVITTTTTTSTMSTPATSSSGGYLSKDASLYYQRYRNRTQNFQSSSPTYVSHQTHSRPQLVHDMEFRGADSRSMTPCENGFQRNHLGACVDVNECAFNYSCKSHQRCINTNGSYRCQNLLQCATGYKSTPDGQTCIDIDECETGEHNCAENEICRNRNGGYICSCPPGHQLTRLPNGVNRCTDINECEQDPLQQQRSAPSVCPSNAQCLNTIGSYYCECKSGFQKSNDNDRICLDVDECQTIPGLCQQKCVNFWGGYRCTCNSGYELSADNRTCNDVDECEVHKSYKLCMGFCNNVPGSYECSCPRGYTIAMDKTTCRDIDECASGDFCTGRYDVCTNIRGSYKCTTIQCPYGYLNDPDQKNRCRQTSNLCEGDECYNKPSAYTYNFITLVSKLMIPPEGRTIFSLRGPIWYDDIDFDLKIIKMQAAANIEKASDNHFDTIKGKHEVHLSLKRTLEGPQDIELELSMTVFTNGMPRGKSVAKIFILVSQYTF